MEDLATEMKSQTDLLQCFMDISQDNQQRIVKALESQAKSFSEYLDFLKSQTSKHNLTAAEQLEDTLGLESDLLATSTRHLLETSK